MTIHSYLQGGLGNQMFQYAIARALSEHYKTNFALNRNWFDTDQGEATPRELQLNQLNIKGVEISSDCFPKKPRGIKRLLQKLLPIEPLVIYQRNAFSFDPTLFHLNALDRRDVYLSGYWQAFRYIEAIKEQLQTEFQIKLGLLPQYLSYSEKINATDSVMLHVRRGDYVQSAAAARYHTILPITYYQDAMKDLLISVPNAHFFIFSDDLDWAKQAFTQVNQKTFIERTDAPNATAQELQLMIACKHHIIANSTLSWWGAWLKQQEGGLVYAPNLWVNDHAQDLSSLLPATWKRITF